MTVDEKIFRLQIPIDDVQAVEVLEGQSDLGRVEPGPCLAESTDLAKVLEHLSSGHKLHHHEQVGVVLEVTLHADVEGKGDGLGPIL